MSVTRIQNNQIYSSTIQAYQKVVPGSITGNLFAPTVTINSNISVIGNLTVSGDTSQINSVNTYVNDPLVVFNNGYTGSLSGYDIGMIVNRNLASLAPYGSVNTAWIWVENDQAFEAIATTETGTNVSSINNSGWANVKVGNLTSVTSTVNGTLTVSGATQLNNTLGVTGVVSFTNSTTSTSTSTGAFKLTGGAGIGGNVVAGGQLQAATGLYSVGTFNGGYSDGVVVDYTTGVGRISVGASDSLKVYSEGVAATETLVIAATSGNVVIPSTTTSTSTSTGALVVKGGAGLVGNVYAGGQVQAATGLYSVGAFNGGYSDGIVADYVTGTGRISVGASDGLKIYNGGVAGTELLVIDTTGNIVIPATTVSSSASTGALVVKGGVGITGAINQTGGYTMSGNMAVNGGGLTTTSTTGYLFNENTTTLNVGAAATTINAGNASGTTNLLGILKVGGNIVAAATTGSSSTTTGALVVKGGAGIAADLNVGGSLTLGGNLYVNGTVEYVNSIVTTHQDPILELNTGPNAAALTGSTVDSGIKTHYYNGSSDVTAFFGRTNDTGYFEYYSLATEAGNVVSGTYGTIKTGNLIAATSTTSTSTSTGALVVAGGAGIGGNLNVGVYNTSLHNIRGNVLFGQGPIVESTDTIITINQNSVAPITSNATVHLSAAEGKSAIYGADTIGLGWSGVHSRKARGTASSPTAVQQHDVLVGYTGSGRGATGFTYANAIQSSGLTILADQNFTDSAQGTRVNLSYVPTGTTTANIGISIRSDGSTLFPQTNESTDVNSGGVILQGGLAVNKVTNHGGNVVISSGTNMTDATHAALMVTGTGGASIAGNVYMGQNLYIGASSLSTNLQTPTIVAADSGNAYAQMAIMNTANTGSADVAAYASNGDDSGGWVDMGFTGTAFGDTNYTITKNNDGYLFARPKSSYGGNLVIATSEAGTVNDVVIGVGSFLSSAEVARFSGNASTSGTFTVKLPTNAVPAANTGAFRVWGGGSFSSNLYVGGAVTLNGSQTAANDVLVKGVNDSTLIWARPNAAYDQVIIGNSAIASTAVRGAKLIINSTDSMLLPIGTNAQRPSSTGGTDTQGMFRYNTTLNGLEYYDGDSWEAITTQFTVIVDQQFSGDGTTTNFTLSQNSTTAGIIVSINGVIQIPTLAYSVTGDTTLAFTEAPILGDVIDVRMLTTTQTVSGLASVNGYMQVQTDNSGVYIYTGAAATAVTTYWNTDGAKICSIANVSVASANTATTIDTMSTDSYRSAKYIIQVTNGTNYQVCEALLISNGTTATVTTYGTVQTNGNLGIVSATQSGTNALLQFIATNSSNQVRVQKDYMSK